MAWQLVYFCLVIAVLVSLHSCSDSVREKPLLTNKNDVGERILVLNALGWNNYSAVHALETVLETATLLHNNHPNEWNALSSRSLFVWGGDKIIESLSQYRQKYITNVLKLTVHPITSKPWTRNRVGDSSNREEKVSAIFSALDHVVRLDDIRNNGMDTTSSFSNPNRILVSISSTAKSLAVPLPRFFDIFHVVRQGSPYSVALPAKTAQFTSESDWHDLQVLALRLDRSGLKWLHDVKSTMESYAIRPAFCMHEPRPAIMEGMECKMM
jgi:hypothetical protein